MLPSVLQATSAARILAEASTSFSASPIQTADRRRRSSAGQRLSHCRAASLAPPSRIVLAIGSTSPALVSGSARHSLADAADSQPPTLKERAGDEDTVRHGGK